MSEENQQGTPTEAEIAWLSGIIEGEGTLALSAFVRNEKGANPKIGLEVKIYNTDATLIEACLDIIRRLGIEPYINERPQKPMRKPDGEGYYQVLDSMISVIVKRLDDVYKLLSLIRPWLLGQKRARAEIMLRYLERRFFKFEQAGGNKRQPYDLGDIKLVKRFYELTRVKTNRSVERLLNELERCPGRYPG